MQISVSNIKKHLPIIAFALILIIGAFFRLYRIRDYMVFLGDEGRDVLVVKRMIIDHKFTLLGPITSVGSMYIGPIYYYFMAPFLWVWGFDPVGPAIMVALFSTATIWLIYYATSRYHSRFAGLVASFLYAISPFAISQGRSSWNPNIVPFFSLLIIFSLLKALIEKRYRFLFITGLALGICFQLHYITLIFIPIIFFSLALVKFKIPLKNYLLLLAGFVLAFSPFLIFELRHSFTNTRAVLNFATQNGQSTVFSLTNFVNSLYDLLIRVFWRLVIIDSAEITKVFLFIGFISVGAYFYKLRKKPLFLQIIFIWFFAGLISMSLYRGPFYDYYFVPLFALPFILTGIFINLISRQGKWGLILSLFIVLILVYFNFKKSPLLMPPNKLLQNTEETSKFVFNLVDHHPYNFALIAGRNSDHAYRYFLELWGTPPVTIENPYVDPERKTVTESLYIICEEKICQPLGHPLWEIAGFGRAEIAGEWQVKTSTVFKLVHYKSI